MKKSTILLVFCIAILSLPKLSFAWGKRGHQMVAQIAFHFLDNATKQKVLSALGNMTIEDAATWMDDVRSKPQFDFMRQWHFINLEKGEVYIPSDKKNIISELERVIKELKHKENLTKEELATDLRVLFHLVGDLHQPLHVGYGSDIGGNSVYVSFLGSHSDLHKVWDNGIISNKNITTGDCLQGFKSLSAAQVKAIKNINVLTWMGQSRSLLNRAYNFSGYKITMPYVNRNQLVIKKQLLLAGLRLASVLENVFRN